VKAGEGQKATKQKTSAFKVGKVLSPTVPGSWLDGVPQTDILRPDFKRTTSYYFPTDADDVDWTLSEGEWETSAPVRAKQPTRGNLWP
jgi:hypothetical protein